MIAHLTGTVARREADSVVVDVNGVGYRVFVPKSVLAALPIDGEKFTLFTTMTVREDDISLFGFASPEEQNVFIMLTGVSGVGARIGLALLSGLDIAELARAVSSNDTRTLTKVTGVGPKLAQRICLELGEKMAELAFHRRVDALAAKQTPAQNAIYEDVVEALVNLGYGRHDSRNAAERALSAATDKNNASMLVRDALNLLSGEGVR